MNWNRRNGQRSFRYAWLPLCAFVPGTALGQALDFSIESVQLCPLDANEFQVAVTLGHVPDTDVFPSASSVLVVIDVLGPVTPGAPDPHEVEFFYPDDPHAGCRAQPPPGCAAGACKKWVIEYKEKLQKVQPLCTNVAAEGCKCVANLVLPPKKKDKHDGPGPYCVMVTIDADGRYPELDEGNNRWTQFLFEGDPPCPLGACCFEDGTCAEGMTFFDCSDAFGSYAGDHTTCATAACLPAGACYVGSGECLRVDGGTCAELGGIYLGDFSACQGERFGLTYCVGAPNSVGPGARILALGSPVVLVNDFTLVAAGLPPGQFGIFFFGPNPIQVPFGNGFLCTGGGLARILPPLLSDKGGVVQRRVDLAAPPASGTIVTGSTWSFQDWYRDPAAGGAAFNTSDAVRVLWL